MRVFEKKAKRKMLFIFKIKKSASKSLDSIYYFIKLKVRNTYFENCLFSKAKKI